MAGVPYSFGYSNKSAVERQPIYSSSVWWAGMNDFPPTPSGPLVRTAYATFIDLVSASDPTTYRCVATSTVPTLLAMIPANFGDGTSYKPTLFGMKAGVSVQIPYNPTVWVADSDRGVLQFTVPPAQLGYAAPFGLTYYQYTEHGNVVVPKNLIVGGDLTVDGATSLRSTLFVSGPATFTSGVAISGPLTVSGASVLNSSLYVSGPATFASSVAVGGPLTVSGASVLNSSLYVSGPAVFGNTVAISGPLTVSGASVLNSSLYVSGPAVFGNTVAISGPLTVSGASVLNSSLYVSGPAVFGNTVAISGPLTVSGASVLNSSLYVSGPAVFGNTVAISGPLTVSGASVMNSSLYVSGPAVFGNTVAISGPLYVSGLSTFGGNVGISSSLTVSNGMTLNGPITLAGNGQGSVGYVLTSQGAATPTWTLGGGNFLPIAPSYIATPTSVSINERVTLKFTISGDLSIFSVQDWISTITPLYVDRWGLHGYAANGNTDNFNALIAANGPMPMYYTLVENRASRAINLPSPLNYIGVQITIKSIYPSSSIDITSGSGFGTLILPSEREPSAPSAKQFNVGGVLQAYSNGEYWISTIYYGGSP